MIADLIAQLNDVDAVVRQDAATSLGDLGHQASEAVDVLRQRLLSAEVSYHDRACAAWALWQIVARGNEQVVADLLHVLQTETRSPDADNLRRYCGFAVEELTADCEALELVRRSRDADPYWMQASEINRQIPDGLDLG